MSKPFLAAFSLALLAVAGVVYWVFASTRGNHLEPSGKILNVRTAALDESHSAVLLDFTVVNPSDVEMIVRSIDISLEQANGSKPQSFAIAVTDMPQLLRYHKELGSLDNEAMRERDRIEPHQTVTRSTAARFDIPEGDLKARRNVQLTIEDVTGPKLLLIAK